MELYFAPLACSMATRIALYEAGAGAQFRQVDTRAKQVEGGTDYLTVNPLGMVPALRTDAGELLTENAAVLQYVADQIPGARLAPAGGLERYALQKWLSFIGTELHKATFIPMLDSRSNEGAKSYARERAQGRFAYLNDYLDGREFLLERFTVADAYLVTVLNWAQFAGVELAQWPAVQAYFTRMLTRPSIAKALAEEQKLYAEQQARRKAA